MVSENPAAKVSVLWGPIVAAQDGHGVGLQFFRLDPITAAIAWPGKRQVSSRRSNLVLPRCRTDLGPGRHTQSSAANCPPAPRAKQNQQRKTEQLNL